MRTHCVFVSLVGIFSCVHGGRRSQKHTLEASKDAVGESMEFNCPVGVGFSLDFQKNPLSLSKATASLKRMGVKCVRLWHYESDYLTALYAVGIRDVLVNVPTKFLPELSEWNSPRAKDVAETLKPMYDQGMRFRVAVGNEPLASWEGGNTNAKLLLPGMINIHQACQELNLTEVKTTVAFYNGIIAKSYPPHIGEFNTTLASTIKEVATFIQKTGGDFVIHLYPFFARMYNSREVTLKSALGEEHHVDGRTYKGVLGMSLAATRAALIKLDPKFATLPISVGECGWPSAGHEDASVKNEEAFYKHVMRDVDGMDDNFRSLYLFEAFDEQAKSQQGHGGTEAKSEDNFGLMTEDGTPKFKLSF